MDQNEIMEEEKEVVSKNFIEQIIEKDLEKGFDYRRITVKGL